MEQFEVDYKTCLNELCEVTSREGSLLVTKGPDGKPNVMTIGWYTAGFVWGKPIMTVYVRPSRFTFGLINNAWEFSVNVMPYSALRTVSYCGRVSGRDDDKFASQNLTPVKGNAIETPYIEQSVIHFECKTLYTHNLPELIGGDIDSRYYPDGDYHRVYYGEIVKCMAVENASKLIQKSE